MTAPEFCNPEFVPGADAYYPCRNGEINGTSQGQSADLYRDYQPRVRCGRAGLPSLLESDPAYIGVIGSRRRWLTTVKALKEKGVSEEKIAAVHSPMGLELNAETPEEIAVSIMAEILMIKDKGTGKQ